jgi:hypothetical protein
MKRGIEIRKGCRFVGHLEMAEITKQGKKGLGMLRNLIEVLLGREYQARPLKPNRP